VVFVDFVPVIPDIYLLLIKDHARKNLALQTSILIVPPTADLALHTNALMPKEQDVSLQYVMTDKE